MTKKYKIYRAIYIFFISVLVLLPSLSKASERQGGFYKIIAKHASGRSFVETKDGYIIAGGAFDKAGHCCIGWAIKIDKSGNKQREKKLGENYNDYNFVKAGIVGNGVALAGATDVYPQPEWHAGQFFAAKMWAARLAEDGTIEWEQRLKSPGEITDANADSFPAVLATDVKAMNGGIVISGYQETGIFHTPAIWALDAKGEVVWTKSIYVEKGQSISAERIYPLRDGDFIVAGGFVNHNNNSPGTWLARISPEGEVEWEKFIETEKSSNDEGLSQSIAIIESGDGLIVGTGQEYLKFSAPDKSGRVRNEKVIASRGAVWLNKFNMNGDLQWRKKIERPGACNIKGLWTGTKQEGEIVVAGETCKGEEKRIWVATLSKEGRVKSIRKLLPARGTVVHQIIQAGEEGLTAVGVLHDGKTDSPATWIYRSQFNSID